MIVLNLHKKLQAADGEMNLNVQMEIEEGQFITLYGESGAGKTSTLRMLSGLLNPDSGRISVGDEIWFDSDKKINLKPQKRKIGFVFQDYALFPNMTVRENLEFALRPGQGKHTATDLIEIVELGELQNRKPETLSGGQQQRVALARALVQRPDILLLDEPLAALDIKIRLKLQDYLLKVHREFNLTTLLISHDIGEIIKLSDKVFIIEKGKVTKRGKPSEIFTNKQIDGQFKLTGEVLEIVENEVAVLIQSNVVKIKMESHQVQAFTIGDKVLVVSQNFEPEIFRIL